jgi:hypothetical protein
VAHLKVTSSFGKTSARTFTLGPLLPGETIAVHGSVPVRPAGQVVAEATVVAVGARSSAQTSQWSFPWGALAILLLVLTLAALVLVRWWGRRRRSHGSADPGLAASVDAMQDELAGVADTNVI